MRFGRPFLRAAVVLCTSIAPYPQLGRTVADDNIRRAELSQIESGTISERNIPWAFSADPSGAGWHLSAVPNDSKQSSLEDCGQRHPMGDCGGDAFSEGCPTR